MTEITIKNSYKVLVADDDDLIRKMISNTLEKKGFEVTLAKDGDEALSLATGNSYDLIITDIMMPGVEGIEVISEVMNQNPSTKIIAISGEGSAGFTSFLRLAETVGASASLEKPFRPSDLLEKINDMGILV